MRQEDGGSVALGLFMFSFTPASGTTRKQLCAWCEVLLRIRGEASVLESNTPPLQGTHAEQHRALQLSPENLMPLLASVGLGHTPTHHTSIGTHN